MGNFVLIMLNDDKNFLRQTLVLSCFDNREFVECSDYCKHKGDNRLVINRKKVKKKSVFSFTKTQDMKQDMNILLLSFPSLSKNACINDNLDKKLFFYICLFLLLWSMLIIILKIRIY